MIVNGDYDDGVHQVVSPDFLDERQMLFEHRKSILSQMLHWSNTRSRAHVENRGVSISHKITR